MQLPDGTQKGLELILKERNLWPDTRLITNKTREVLSQQPDFEAQKECLEEIVTADVGYLIDYFPKNIVKIVLKKSDLQ